ncbi:hypothetical protein ZOSMA_42G00980 [Zostera marina]|uniref:RanBP2-type domain-containing protein n=1 Tax=Zostera marina TaxID=29655 RepID=A0A0K9P256_ZOSMR|nr:hypothetical protein ZOSMA_42G00980 [Zostera marina]
MSSAKGSHRDSFGTKRSRNEGSRSEGDWTCRDCGNVNFSFRTVCNRSHCGAPRQVVSPRVNSNVLHPASYDHSPPCYGNGIQVQPLHPGMPNNYRVPIPLPALRYNFGLHPNGQNPYELLPGYGPPNSIPGMNYGQGHGLGINDFGYGYRGSPMPVPGPWPIPALSDNNGSRKRRGGPDGLSEGDWICPLCDNINFSFRTNCNMKKCNAPRPTTIPATNLRSRDSTETPEGSWTCNECGNLNYPFRTTCNRKGCENEKPPLPESS